MANRYWVGGSGNWSDSTNHWATSSGGAPGVANTPTHLDNVIFDSNSHTVGYTVTMDKEAFCADMTWGNPASGAPTWAGSTALNVYGSLSLVSGMTRTFTGNIAFKATSTGKTFTTNTVSLASSISFNGIGGGWTIQDALNAGTGTVSLTSGTLDTNGQTITCAAFASSGSITRTLTLGASVINCTSFNIGVNLNLTFNYDTSSIRITGSNGLLSGGGKTFYEVQLNGTVHPITGANTFTTLTRTATATKTDTLTLSDNQTVTGTLTLSGNSATNRLLVQSDVKGTPRTITAATVSCSNVDIQDITGAGAGSWNLSAITGLSGDCGGNSGITFTTGANQYMKTAVSVNWSASNWYTTSGGAVAGRVPLPQDTAIFDANSITAGSVVITADMPRMSGIDCTGCTNSPTWASSISTSIFGSVLLTANGLKQPNTVSSITFEGRGSFGITSNSISLRAPFTVDAPGGTYTLQDAFVTDNNFTVTSGTFTTGNNNLTATNFASSNSNTRTINLGSSTVTLSGTSNTVNFGTSTGLTFNAGTSTITCSGNNPATLGGGVTFYNLTYSAVTTTPSITGANSYNNLSITVASGKVATLSITNNQTISGTLTLAGNSSVNRLLVQSGTKGTQVTLTVNTTVTASNVDIQDMLGAGSASWNLSGITGNSGDCGGNSGITFTSPVTTNWVSGATWSTATWSSRVPLPQDTATFTTAGVATITQDMPRIGSVDFSTSADKTWTTSTAASVFGSIDLTNLATLTASTNTYTYEGRGSSTLTTAGKSWAKAITVTAPGGTLTLADLITITSTSGLNLNNGTLTASNSGVVTTSFNTNVTTTRTLNMGNGTWECTSNGNIFNVGTATGLTLNPGTSTIKFTESGASAKNFVGGGNTFYNFWNATASTGAVVVSGSNTFNDFKIDAGRTMNFTAFTVQTVSSLTAVGTVGNVITLQSSTAGSRWYLKDTNGTNTCDYLSLQDSGVTGGATWVAGTNSTYVSGNIGWSTNPATDRYWVSGGNGYWDSTTNWSTSSGGASGASVPIGDNVFFDGNSGSGSAFMVSASAITMNNIDCSGFTGTLLSSQAFSIYGNYTLSAGMTLLATSAFTVRYNNTSKSLTTGGKTLLGGVTVDSVSDSVSFADAVSSNSTLTHTSGTLDLNNLSHTFTTFASNNSNTRTINMGSGTLTLTGTTWSTGTTTGLTFNANTSTIKFTEATSQTKTFTGGSLTYNNVWFTGSGTGAFNIVGSNTFNDFKIDTPPHTVNFTAGTTTTVATFTVSGTAGNLMTIGSITASPHTLTKSGGGTVSSDYLSISYSTATPSSTWYAGTHSTDGGNNSGWTFTDAPANNGNFFMFM